MISIEIPRLTERSLWRTASRIAAWLALAVTLAASTGCTMLRLGYGHLDILAASMANDYFDLDPVQKHEFQTRFDRLHDWHRREQLPEYAAFLREANNRYQRGATRDDVAWLMDGVEERYRALARRSADDAVVILMTVTPAQLDNLRQRWEKDNRKFVRDNRLDRSAEEQRTERAKRIVSQIKDWTGPLTDEQEQRLVGILDQTPPTVRLRYEERVRRQGEFLKLMELRSNREVFATRLRLWLVNWEEGRSPAQARQFKEARERRIDLYAATAQMLAPSQRAHLTSRVQGYIGDFTRLAER